MKLILTFHVLIYFVCCTFGESKNYHALIPAYYNIERNDVKCIHTIIKNHFSSKSRVSISFSKAIGNSLIKSINMMERFSVRIRTFEMDIWLLSTDVYIIIINDVNEFSYGIFQMTQDIQWNPRAHFIIQCYNLTQNDLKKVFDVFLWYKVYKVVLLNLKLTNETELRTYFPFDKNYCGEYYDNIVNLGNCEDVDTTNIFPNNEPSLRNCTIKIVAKEDIPNIILASSNFTVFGEYIAGLEQYMLENICAIEHITIEYDYATDDIPYGVVLPNRTATGILGRLQDNTVSIAIGGFVLMKNRIEVFDYIWGYNYADFVLLTPNDDENIWKKVYREFGPKTWALILLAYASMVSFTAISQRCLLKKRMDFVILCIKLWIYFYGKADQRLIQNTKPKGLIILWALFTFFVYSFYNTAYYSLVTGHVKEQRTIDTDEISSIPYEPCISDTIRTIFEYAYNFSFANSNDFPECRFTESAMNTVATKNHLYTIEMSYSYKSREYQYIDDDGDHLMDSWDFLYDTVLTTYVIRGFPLKDKFQKYAFYMYESGLLQRHLKVISIKNLNSIRRFKKKYKKIEISDFRIHFAVLLIGTVISVLCFLIEISKMSAPWSKKTNKVKV